ncbi:MAG: iron ABC transporter substrate-binding protein [Halobacteriales archaeon SW_9_67_25]|nr:MAG: iron ABC transporter substrate-binding protein [Halobacteriales archaeon SW_9_67_25]
MTDEHNDTTRTDSTDGRNRVSRRRFVAATALVGAGTLAGCPGSGGGGDTSDGNAGDGSDGGDGGTPADPTALANFRGSGPLVQQRDSPGGTSITELPDLSGELTLYLGGGEGGLYLDLIERFKNVYPDFEVSTTLDSSAGLANRIIEESAAGTSPADLFMAVDAGSLGAVAGEGGTVSLPSEVTSAVPESLRTDQWVGFAGRARAVPYNTEALSESAIPDTVQKFPGVPEFEGAFGWAPTYSAFQAFVTAMRVLRGRGQTREWLLAMKDHGALQLNDEFLTSNAVADGEIVAGLANHYYALRIKNARQNAPVDITFTTNDAGALINTSGAEIIQGTDNEELAVTFVRHLLSSEAQEFFATTTFAYPTVPEVPPAGGLPTIEELDPPDVDLTELADVEPTLELLRDTDVL